MASRLICLTAAIAAITPNAEKTPAMMTFNQKRKLRLDGLNVKLKNTIGKMKSRGMKPNAPMTALMSPKNGSIAAIMVAVMTDNERVTTLGITFLVENSGLDASPNVFSSTSFVGCR